MAGSIAPTGLLLLVTGLAPLVVVLAGLWRSAAAAATAIALTAAALLLTIWAGVGPAASIDVPWAPSWGLSLAFTPDRLGILYSLLATGVGLLVFLYAAAYMPRHLRHEQRPITDLVPFWAWITAFMSAMVWLALAQDLILIFVCWDATAIASYFLIGYDRQHAASRRAALMAFLVTGVSAVLFLVGALWLGLKYNTLHITDLAGQLQPGPGTTTAVALIAVAALAKSAQVPFHFWLPRAMAAPTPVSAYLHSAAMVAAGVYLLARVFPLLVAAPVVLEALVVVGFASMAVGGLLALANDEFKRLLAYSTIAQYGYVVVLLGLDPQAGPGAAAFAVVAHAVAKSGLFLTAGAVTEATGKKALSHVGGLWRRLPLLALASGVCAAGLAALPLTAGFFKDELFFKAALDRGPVVTMLALAGTALSFGYAMRFWTGIFLGPTRTDVAVEKLPRLLVAPIGVLAFLVLTWGLAPASLAGFAAAAGAVSTGAVKPLAVAYHLDARPENLLALGAFAGGSMLALVAARRADVAVALAETLGHFGPERVYATLLQGLNRFSDAVHRFEVRDLRSRIASILLPAGVLMLAGVLATPSADAYRVGTFSSEDVPLLLVLIVAAIAGVAVTIPRHHVALVLLLSGVGYSLTVVFALVGAPDVALVGVLMETLFALLFLGVLAGLPRPVLARLTRLRGPAALRRRDLVLGVIAGLFAFVASWGVLSRPAALDTVATAQIELAPSAHAKDIVTAILADFRGLDTMGEISVIGIALLGLMTLLRRERSS